MATSLTLPLVPPTREWPCFLNFPEKCNRHSGLHTSSGEHVLLSSQLVSQTNLTECKNLAALSELETGDQQKDFFLPSKQLKLPKTESKFVTLNLDS